MHYSDMKKFVGHCPYDQNFVGASAPSAPWFCHLCSTVKAITVLLSPSQSFSLLLLPISWQYKLLQNIHPS